MLTEPVTEYDRFDYDESSPPLTLDEAIAKADTIRKSSGFIVRVRPTDENLSGFKVDIVSKEEQYADFLERVSRWWGRIISNRRLR